MMALAARSRVLSLSHPKISISSLARLWESVQVELQGRYSLERLHELIAHAKISTATGNVATLLFTPLPALLWTVFIDSFPLEPPERGLSHQTLWLYLRLALMTCLGLLSIAIQVRACVPALPLSTSRLLLLTVIPAVMTAFSLWFQAALWTFPTPVGMMVSEPWFILSTVLCSWWLWKETLRRDPDTKIKFFRFLKVIVVQFSLIGAYVLYYALFSVVGIAYQSYLSVLLPIIKSTFKNMARSGLYFAEDLAPTLIVTNIDIFHMTFVCRTMQQTRGNASVLFIMDVDVVQSIVAYCEVYEIVRHVNALTKESQATDAYSRAIAAADTESPSLRQIMKLKFDIVNFALYLVHTNPRIRGHPTIALPRHIRDLGGVKPDSRTEGEPLGPTTNASVRIVPLETNPPQQVAVRANAVSEVSQAEQTHLQCVASVLKLLHMIEFYVMIEYVETAISTLTTLYVLEISHMPNRVYYFQLKGQSDDDLHQMVQQLALYASLELISFVALCVAFNRHLQHFSTIQQLAFVLQKHWAIVIPTMTSWVFINVLLTLEHFGGSWNFDPVEGRRLMSLAWIDRHGLHVPVQMAPFDVVTVGATKAHILI